MGSRTPRTSRQGCESKEERELVARHQAEARAHGPCAVAVLLGWVWDWLGAGWYRVDRGIVLLENFPSKWKENKAGHRGIVFRKQGGF